MQMPCIMKPECISTRSIVRSVEVGCPNDCLHFHGLWIPGLLGADSQKHSNMVARIVTKSFLLHPWDPTKHCCFSMQGSQFHMIFASFIHPKETNCPLSIVRKAIPTCPCSVKIGSSRICTNLAIVWLFQCV